jgi:anthranilate phosphoribosyltransferase
MVGVYSPDLVEPMAKTLGLLGTETALVVHGSGLDEIATHGPTTAAHLDRGRIELLELSPGEAGVGEHSLDELRGGGPDENAEALRRVLGGQGAPAHEAIIGLNAGALVWLTGQAPDLASGAERAREVIRSGAPLDVLERYARESQRGE